jgi:signal transduction histidine kinase
VTGKLDDLIWSINPKNDSFEKLISRMYSFALPVLQAKNISCSFSYSESLLKERLQVQVKQNLYLIVKELVNNVVKHSNAQHCFITLDCTDNTLVLSVKDDGDGYEVKKIKEGNGIANVKERVDSIRGRIEIKTAPGKGALVTIYKPLKHKYVGLLKKVKI